MVAAAQRAVIALARFKAMDLETPASITTEEALDSQGRRSSRRTNMADDGTGQEPANTALDGRGRPRLGGPTTARSELDSMLDDSGRHVLSALSTERDDRTAARGAWHPRVCRNPGTEVGGRTGRKNQQMRRFGSEGTPFLFRDYYNTLEDRIP